MDEAMDTVDQLPEEGRRTERNNNALGSLKVYGICYITRFFQWLLCLSIEMEILFFPAAFGSSGFQSGFQSGLLG
jgi:hypothetical protein